MNIKQQVNVDSGTFNAHMANIVAVKIAVILLKGRIPTNEFKEIYELLMKIYDHDKAIWDQVLDQCIVELMGSGMTRQEAVIAILKNEGG